MESINLKYLLLVVFGISWLGVIPQLLMAYGVKLPGLINHFDILMTLGPILGAIIFIYKAKGAAGLKMFFYRLFRFRASVFIILFAVLFPVMVSMLSALIGFQLSNTSWPENFTPSIIINNGFIISLSYVIINTEELVWRGIIFDRFLEKNSFIKSCGYLLPIWWIFHLPLFLFPGGHQAGYGLLEFTCIVIAQTFILGWIYTKTTRSLLYVHLHHQLINGFGQAFPIFPVFIAGNMYPIWALCTLLIITTIIIVFNVYRGNIT